MLRTQDLVRVSGVTSRTLRHYDHVGLLRPADTDASGQRWYGPKELVRLQRILVLRELGLSLAEIGQVLDGATGDRAALVTHVEQLRRERDRVDRMIRAVETTLARLEFGMTIDESEMFEGFADDPYAEEAERRWPDHYAESRRRLGRMTKQEQAELFARGGEVTAAIAALFTSGAPTAAPEVQELVGQHHAWVSAFWTPDRQAFIALGRGYVEDARFTATYDAIAPGLASYLCDAMEIWAEANLVE